jgi:hypothetical protein
MNEIAEVGDDEDSDEAEWWHRFSFFTPEYY